ncbi:unnamed protein product [Sphagnum troendelagicum]|uniref:Uncharacterized protein n=1 Tax=Sphagnum troendelagicum TaxID=128251 RepID=A0ABP0UCX3_9BRYO
MQKKNSTHAEQMRRPEALHLRNTTTRRQTKPTREGRQGEWRGGGEAKHRNRTAQHCAAPAQAGRRRRRTTTPGSNRAGPVDSRVYQYIRVGFRFAMRSQPRPVWFLYRSDEAALDPV